MPRPDQCKPSEESASTGEGAPVAPPRTALNRLVRDWLIPIGIVMGIMAPIRSVVADWNDVPSGSMRPTILEGDRIYVDKLAFGLRVPFTTMWISRWDTPHRGDVITFASPVDGTRLVKRTVGVPGDHIELRSNRLFINGQEMDLSVTDASATAPIPSGAHIPVVLATENLNGVEHGITLTPSALSPARTYPETIVPEGRYFVMGDNRDQSNDSRFIGMVPIDSIYGRCKAIALSLDPEHSYTPRWDRWFSGVR